MKQNIAYDFQINRLKVNKTIGNLKIGLIKNIVILMILETSKFLSFKTYKEFFKSKGIILDHNKREEFIENQLLKNCYMRVA